jgi:hypothetical protein
MNLLRSWGIPTLLTLCLYAYMLPLARLSVRVWTVLYTFAATYETRTRRREEVAALLHDHVERLRLEGCRPSEIGLQVLCAWVCGIPADLAWAVAQIVPRLLRHVIPARSPGDKRVIIQLIIADVAMLAVQGVSCALHVPYYLLVPSTAFSTQSAMLLLRRRSVLTLWKRRLLTLPATVSMLIPVLVRHSHIDAIILSAVIALPLFGTLSLWLICDLMSEPRQRQRERLKHDPTHAP